MLLIYSSLPVGGIETFFSRLTKERSHGNLKTSVLLLSSEMESNQELLNEIRKYSDVYFYKDIFKFYKFFDKLKILRAPFTLLMPMRLKLLESILSECTQIHVTNGVHALLGKRIINLLNISIPITVGVYHSQEFAWGGRILPYFERINRRFVLDALCSKNLFCFYPTTMNFIRRQTGYSIEDAKDFRLGVVTNEKLSPRIGINSSKCLRICMIGRLVDFKKYNFSMVQVVSDLNREGYDVLLDIYGDGPMLDQIKEKISAAEIGERVSLKGSIDYSSFNQVVSTYDLFLGSGTSIVQAASQGVVSIIGIESNPDPTSYGFFSNFYKDEYHHPDLGYIKISIKELIIGYIKSKDKDQLSKQHIDAANFFSMKLCSDNFEKDLSNDIKPFKYLKIFYVVSYSIFFIYMRIFKKTIYVRNV